MASAQPRPEPNPKTADSPRFRPRSTMRSDAPRMAQFTAMSGRNTPREAWSAGKWRSRTISTTCTVAAMVPMKVRNCRNERSWSASASPNQPSAPGRSR